MTVTSDDRAGAMTPGMATWIVRTDEPGGGPRLAVTDAVDVAGLPTAAGCRAVAERAAPAAALEAALP